jgi:hypothetical protein
MNQTQKVMTSTLAFVGLSVGTWAAEKNSTFEDFVKNNHWPWKPYTVVAGSKFFAPTTQYCLAPSGGTVTCFSTNPPFTSGTGGGAVAAYPGYFIKSDNPPAGYPNLISAKFYLVGPHPCWGASNNLATGQGSTVGAGSWATCVQKLSGVPNVVLWNYNIEGEATPPKQVVVGTAYLTDQQGNYIPGSPPMTWSQSREGADFEPAALVLVYGP